MTRNIRYLLAFTLISVSHASYCGPAAIPFTFQVLHSGLTVLGCAKPKCFGWNPNGSSANESAQFYRIDGKEDGYLRQSDQPPRSPSRNSMASSVATCEKHYSTEACAPGQWVGGIAPQALVQSSKLQIRCCSHAPLLNSEDRGVAMVSNGQLVVGGEVMNDGNLEGFDYIANIKTERNQNGNNVYAVSIRRMMCTEEEIEPESQISENAVVHNLDGDAKTRRIPFKQHSSNNLQVSGSFYTNSPPQVAPSHIQPPHPQYAATVTLTPYIISSNPVVPYVPQTQTATASPFDLRNPSQTPQYNPFQVPTIIQPSNGLNTGYQSYNPLIQPASHAPQPLSGIFSSVIDNNMTPQHSRPLGPLPVNGQSQVPLVFSTTPLPTIPPFTFPTLDQISKINIPSVEDVENVIPPVQKAIITTVAKLFGVL